MKLLSRLFKHSIFVYLIFLFSPCDCTAFTGDSTKYLTLKDTIFIRLESNGEKIFEHSLDKKQTLYSLARFYGMNVEMLYPYNSNLKLSSVDVGTKVRVPIPNGAIIRYKTKDFKSWKYVPVYFRVQKGDNLFKIAKTLFHQPVDSVLAKNKLTSKTVSDGQLLHVGWMSVNGIPDSVRLKRGHAISSNYNQGLFTKQKNSSHEQKGVAVWQKKGSLKTESYCLHRSAKIGSIVEITNPMKSKTIYAKVIGKIPENSHGNEVIIMVAPTVAKSLGAVDERFYVKIRFSQ
jgi:LysM repeat protein